MNDKSSLVQCVKYICETCLWLGVVGFSVHGCVQCHKSDVETLRSNATALPKGEENKP